MLLRTTGICGPYKGPPTHKIPAPAFSRLREVVGNGRPRTPQATGRSLARPDFTMGAVPESGLVALHGVTGCSSTLKPCNSVEFLYQPLVPQTVAESTPVACP